MLLIEGEIGGKKYREPFSKGILSKSLVPVSYTHIFCIIFKIIFISDN